MIFNWIFICTIIIVLIILLPRMATQIYSRGKIYDTNNAPAFPIAIVFGAGLRHDGTPTPILKDRVATAANLYFQGIVQKILMSGDNRFIEYNEPGSMLAYAVELGVPEADIVLDYAGRRTYDTCYRAKYIFGVDKAILVTQRFHLPRAIFTCNMLGVKADGVLADRRVIHQSTQILWDLRELFATVAAFWDLGLRHPTPILGDAEPIFTETPE